MEQDLKRQILNILERNSRLTAEEIAVMTGSDEKTVTETIEGLEKGGILCGYHALINWDKVDDDTVCCIVCATNLLWILLWILFCNLSLCF